MASSGTDPRPAVPPATAPGGAAPHHRHIHHQQQQQQPPPLRQPTARVELRSPPRSLAHGASRVARLPGSTKAGGEPAGGGSGSSAGCALLPRTTTALWRLMAGSIALLLFVQALSCGMFFCVQLPFAARAHADYTDLITEVGDVTSASAGDAQPPAAGGTLPAARDAWSAARGAAAAGPKLIPRVIHQAHAGSSLPAPARGLVRSWAERNGPAWAVRLYGPEAALAFVRREFPEYYEPFSGMPSDAERAAFFRFMVLLRLGGAYADVDVECRAPLDNIIAPADTLLVGWDDPGPASPGGSTAATLRVAPWFFAAAPGHPLLRRVCEDIAHGVNTAAHSNGTATADADAREHSGVARWTELVLQHALSRPVAQADDPWRVRILPRVAFGVRPNSGPDEVLGPHVPGVVVLHHSLGWQGPPVHRKALQLVAPLMPSWTRSGAQQERAQRSAVAVPASSGVASVDSTGAVANTALIPVSVDFYPPFVMMTDASSVMMTSTLSSASGPYDGNAHTDVGAAIAAHGTWQPGVAPYRRPSVVEALVGALGKHAASKSVPGRPPPLQQQQQPAGTAGGTVQHVTAASTQDAAESPATAAATAAAARHQESSQQPGATAQQPAQAAGLGSTFVDVGAGLGFFSLAAAARGHHVVALEASAHSRSAMQASLKYNGLQGLVDVRALPDTETLAVHALSEALANTSDVGVLRIAVRGREAALLDAAAPLLMSPSRRPGVVYVELWPASTHAAGNAAGPMALLRRLHALGYSDIAHAGRVCDGRWFNVTHVLRLQAPPAPTSHVLMQQPTWCKLRPENFAMLIEHATPGTPENVLFVLGAPPQQQLQPQQQHGASGVAAGSGGNGSSAANGSSVPAPVHSSEASVVMAELHNKSMNAAAQAAQQPVGRRLAR